ncbi:MAG: hypothetical protein R2861_14385 [Desulfobacterales bacterium]
MSEAAIARRISMTGDTTYDVNLVKIPDGGAVVVFHDISELVRLEKVRGIFVANVSHELRTLTSIKGCMRKPFWMKIQGIGILGSFCADHH